ncbi:MAG: peptide chain release factor N(5)-glutamine methyltransferase [Candidatus Aminicenantes bacterium]|nr:peptide chain release factor N(5)-glutamine methyltransferase [Candidatus Aminicenantes bacterium]
MTYRDLLKEGIGFLQGGTSPELDARCLLLHASGLTEVDLHRNPEKSVPIPIFRRFRRFLRRRADGCPVAYIVGKKYFWKDEFRVGRGVLIPRPETELIVESVLRLRSPETRRIADLGTGSGNIVLSLARELLDVEFFGVERSRRALNYAIKNRGRLAVPNVRFLMGSWFQPFADHGWGDFDFILSNPPYVSAADWKKLEKGIRHFEPRPALLPGESGLEALSLIVHRSPEFLRRGGFLIVEIGYGQKKDVLSLFDGRWNSVIVENDLNDIPRILIAQKKATSSI